MTWRTSNLTVTFRSLLRRLGLTAKLSNLFAGQGYEARFEERLMSQVNAHDIVWDVGANHGVYTAKFCKAVGPAGRVVAFEPSPGNFRVLERNCGSTSNVELVQVALGRTNEQVCFAQGEDALGATSKIVPDGGRDHDRPLKVRQVRGEYLIKEADLAVPNVIKVDTEGYELEVLAGMGSILNDSEIRTIAVEVHFGLLEQLGYPNGARELTNLLEASGFKCIWTDPSHIVAIRQRD